MISASTALAARRGAPGLPAREAGFEPGGDPEGDPAREPEPVLAVFTRLASGRLLDPADPAAIAAMEADITGLSALRLSPDDDDEPTASKDAANGGDSARPVGLTLRANAGLDERLACLLPILEALRVGLVAR